MADMTEKHRMGSIRFTSWNVKGLGGPIKRARVFSHLKNLNTNIAFLQETHLRLCDHTRLRKPWIWQVFYSTFNIRSKGTAILLYKRFQFSSNMARTLNTLTDQIGCMDVWRFHHWTAREFSFCSHLHQAHSHIDYFFLDKILLPSVKLCKYSAIVISDHAPLLFDLELLSKGEKSPKLETKLHWLD